jgi:hypothetical protein
MYLVGICISLIDCRLKQKVEYYKELVDDKDAFDKKLNSIIPKFETFKKGKELKFDHKNLFIFFRLLSKELKVPALSKSEIFNAELFGDIK